MNCVENKIMKTIKSQLEGMLPLDYLDVDSAVCELNDDNIILEMKTGTRITKFLISINQISNILIGE